MDTGSGVRADLGGRVSLDASTGGDGAAAAIGDVLDTPGLRWRMAAVLFGINSTIGALSLLFAHPETFHTAMLWTNVGASYAVMLICYAGSRRLTATWPIHVILVVGTLLITRAAYYSGEAGGFYTLFYVWVGLYAFFFFPRRLAVAHLACVGIASGWLLADLDPGAATGRWITTVGTISLAAYLIDSLVRHLRAMARGEAAVARERAELMRRLEQVARTDELTGLPNRRAWDEELRRELGRARRERAPLSVVLIDLDHFKSYNDDHGHQAGDRLLKELAAAWRQELRTTDIIARYGGEEFSLALPGCDVADAAQLVERLRGAVPERETASAGIVLWDGAEDPDELLGRADVALYAAKAAGRNRVVYA